MDIGLLFWDQMTLSLVSVVLLASAPQRLPATGNDGDHEHLVDAVFDAIDVDQDGILGLAELAAWERIRRASKSCTAQGMQLEKMQAMKGGLRTMKQAGSGALSSGAVAMRRAGSSVQSSAASARQAVKEKAAGLKGGEGGGDNICSPGCIQASEGGADGTEDPAQDTTEVAAEGEGVTTPAQDGRVQPS